MSAEIVQTVRRIELPREELSLGRAAGMRKTRERIEGALHDDLPVLIEGESGTGKEVVGRFLHKNSNRGEGPFLKLNCAAAAASLLEGEIYGYEKCAVASTQRPGSGSIGLASDGTLFLD